jgi:hypothetical protein
VVCVGEGEGLHSGGTTVRNDVVGTPSAIAPPDVVRTLAGSAAAQGLVRLFALPTRTSLALASA